MKTLNVPEGTVVVDHSDGEVLIEISCGEPSRLGNTSGVASVWLTVEQALELAATLTGVLLLASRERDSMQAEED